MSNIGTPLFPNPTGLDYNIPDLYLELDEMDNNGSSSSSFSSSSSCPEGLPALLDQPEIRFPVICAYVLVFLVCLLGNLFTIIVICVHRSMRTATNFFLANLAFADLLVSIFCILQNMFHVVGSTNAHWPLGAQACKLYILVLHLVPCAGIGILVCVSLEKYIAVLHPLLALKILTPKLRVGMMLCIWAGSLLCNLPYYFTTRELRYGEIAVCVRDMQEDSSVKTRDVITISFVVWYCIPLATIAFLYTRIGMVLWNGRLKPLSIRISSDGYSTGSATLTVVHPHQQQQNGTSNGDLAAATATGSNGTSLNPVAVAQYPQSNNGPPAMSASNTSIGLSGGSKVHEAVGTPVPSLALSTAGANNGDVLESRKKIVRLLIAIVCSFAILTLPHHARLLFVMWIESDSCTSSWTALLQPATYLCLFLSFSVNPFLYARSQRFREAFRDIVKCRTGKAMRKYTRTRTLLSDVAMSSRSPSLSRLTNGHLTSASNNNLTLVHKQSHKSSTPSKFLFNHFLHVHNGGGHQSNGYSTHQSSAAAAAQNGGARTRLIRSESGEPQANGGKREKKVVHKSLYRKTRI